MGQEQEDELLGRKAREYVETHKRLLALYMEAKDIGIALEKLALALKEGPCAATIDDPSTLDANRIGRLIRDIKEEMRKSGELQEFLQGQGIKLTPTDLKA